MRTLSPWLVLCALLASITPSSAQKPLILVVSQPAQQMPAAEFVDIGYFVVRGLQDSGKYAGLLFKTNDPEIRAAIDAKKLLQAEVVVPITVDGAHRVAEAVGAIMMVKVSGRNTRNGVACEMQVDELVSQHRWATVLSTSLAPFRSRSRRASILEAVNAHAATIVSRITGKPATPPSEAGPSARVADPGKTPLTEKTTKGGSSRKTAGGGDPKPVGTAATAKQTDAMPKATPVGGADPAPPATGDSQSLGAPMASEMLIDKFRQQGDQANLIVSLRRAITDRPREVRLRRDLVTAYLDRGWAAAGRDEAARAVELLPTDGSLRRLLGECRLAAGENDAAIVDFREAIRMAPGDAAAHVALGDALLAQAKPEQAMAAFAAGALADQKAAMPHRRLAQLYARQGKLAECSAEFKTAMALTGETHRADLTTDAAAILVSAEGTMNDAVGRLQTARKAMLDGQATREITHRETMAVKALAVDFTDFLAGLAVPSALVPARAQYVQAASLIAQAAESAANFLETRDEADEKQATILRVESTKQILEASRVLQAATRSRTGG